MRDKPRETLCRLVEERGPGLLDNPRLCESLLRDLCPGGEGEISTIVSGLQLGVATKFRTSMSSAQPTEMVIRQLVQQLQQKRHMAEYAARWAVESIALALKVISPNELTLIEESWNIVTQTPGTPTSSQPVLAPPQSSVSPSMNPTEKVKTHLTKAILVTLCCCLPGGIVAIVYASRARACLETGDVAGARKAASSARGWITASAIIGLIAWFIYMLAMMAEM